MVDDLPIVKEYPMLVCLPCGIKYQRRQNNTVACRTHGVCGICGKETACTSPALFGGVLVDVRLPDGNQ